MNNFYQNFDENELHDYCVYAHVCKVQGEDYNKTYIGVTNNIKTRWRSNGQDYRHSTQIYKAFKKYGWENFEHIVLIEHITLEMADLFEKFLIKKFNTNYKKGGFGYNANDGGIVYRYKYNTIYQYDLNGIYIQSFDSFSSAAETVGCDKVTIRNCITKNTRYAAFFLWSDVYVDRLDPYESRIFKYVGEPILQVSLQGKIIKKYPDVYSIDGYVTADIIKSCNGTYVSSQGYFWFYESEYSILSLNEKIRNNKKKKIDVYDLDLNYIATCNSISDASICYKIDGRHITNCCNNPGLYYKKYIFLYHGTEKPTKLICNKDHVKPNTKNNTKNKNDNNRENGRKIAVLDKKTHSIIQVFESIKFAFQLIGDKNKGKIYEVCNGKRKSIYGYVWRFIDDNGNIIEP